MSTATLPSPQEAVRQAELDYVMPPVEYGQFVMFYADNGANDNSAVVAQVIGIDRQCLHLNVFGQHDFPQTFISHKSLVRHISDPKLRTNNQFVTKYGSWDYTPWEKSLRGKIAAQRDDIEELRLTVQKLVADLGGGSSKNKKAE